MLHWQYKILLQQLDLLQLHASDPHCPCSLADIGEWCIPKHLNAIAGLAAETSAMDSANKLMLMDLQEEADDFHEKAVKAICRESDEAIDLVGWSRERRKEIERLYYLCRTGKAEVMEAHQETPDMTVIAEAACGAGVCTAQLSDRLSREQRAEIESGNFACPENAPGPGSYPIEDLDHAIDAMVYYQREGYQHCPGGQERICTAFKKFDYRSKATDAFCGAKIGA